MTTDDIESQLGELYEIATEQQKIAANLLDQARAERERAQEERTAALDALNSLPDTLASQLRKSVASATKQAIADGVHNALRVAAEESTAQAEKMRQAGEKMLQSGDYLRQWAELIRTRALFGQWGFILVCALCMVMAGMVSVWGGDKLYQHQTEKLRQERDALSQEIAELKSTKAALDADPLIRMKMSTCRDGNGVLWRCVLTDENAGTFGNDGYRIIRGLKPLQK